MRKPTPDMLGAVFGMEPEQAVSFLKDKGLAFTGHWGEMLDEAHARAFTVARCARMDVLQDIRNGLLDAMKNGKTFRDFRRELEPLLVQKGWWGKKLVAGADGREKSVQLGSPRRLRTIFQTNLRSAHMAGQMAEEMAADAFVYRSYWALMDGRTRPAHRALHGRVYRKDDPIWGAIYPPNGFNCRCSTRVYTEAKAKRLGLKVEDSKDHTVTRTVDVGPDRVTGELFPATQTGVRVKMENGKPGIMWVDPGFNSSPLASHLLDQQLAKKAAAALNDGPEALKLVRETVLAPTRIRAWSAFVESTERFGKSQKRTMAVGVLPHELASQLKFNPVMVVEDRIIVGKKAARHMAAENNLSMGQWKEFPLRLRDASWLVDTRNGNLVALMPDGVAAFIEPSGNVASTYIDAAMKEKIKNGIIKKTRP